jgi:type II secretory pathway component PulC
MRCKMQKLEVKIRVPRNIKDWLVEQVAENGSSQNSEIVRAVRERMARHRNESGVPVGKQPGRER